MECQSAVKVYENKGTLSRWQLDLLDLPGARFVPHSPHQNGTKTTNKQLYLNWRVWESILGSTRGAVRSLWSMEVHVAHTERGARHPTSPTLSTLPCLSWSQGDFFLWGDGKKEILGGLPSPPQTVAAIPTRGSSSLQRPQILCGQLSHNYTAALPERRNLWDSPHPCDLSCHGTVPSWKLDALLERALPWETVGTKSPIPVAPLSFHYVHTSAYTTNTLTA